MSESKSSNDAAPVTEILLFPTTPDFANADGWIDTRRTLSAVPGVLRQYWGTQVDDAEQGVLLVSWDSMSSRTAFPLTPEFPDFIAKCLTYLTVPASEIRFQHAYLRPHPPTSALTAPVVEIGRVKLKDGADKDSFERDVLVKLVEDMAKVEGCSGSAAGPIAEDPTIFFVVTGWESLQAHAQAVASKTAPFYDFFEVTSYAEDISAHFYTLQYPPGDGKTIA